MNNDIFNINSDLELVNIKKDLELFEKVISITGNYDVSKIQKAFISAIQFKIDQIDKEPKYSWKISEIEQRRSKYELLQNALIGVEL